MNWKERLEKRWGVQGWYQLSIIFIVFAITGSSSVFVRKHLLNAIGITSDTSAWIRLPVSILGVFIIYQILLLFFGFLFGQFTFFWNFEMNMYHRIGKLFRKKDSSTTPPES